MFALTYDGLLAEFDAAMGTPPAGLQSTSAAGGAVSLAVGRTARVVAVGDASGQTLLLGSALFDGTFNEPPAPPPLLPSPLPTDSFTGQLLGPGNSAPAHASEGLLAFVEAGDEPASSMAGTTAVVGRPRAQIDPAVRAAVRQQGALWVAPYPRNRHRNQAPPPPEYERKARKGGAVRSGVLHTYAAVEGWRDLAFDPRAENPTRFGVLEPAPGPQNAGLVALYHVLEAHNAVAGHLCSRELCLACQTGFLFRTCSPSHPPPPPTPRRW
jgi:hypothetical protein